MLHIANAIDHYGNLVIVHSDMALATTVCVIDQRIILAANNNEDNDRVDGTAFSADLLKTDIRVRFT